MGLIDKIRSIFGSGSTAAGPAPPSQSEEPEAEPEEPEAEPEAEEEEAEGEEEEDDGGMSTKAVAEMADPRRREGEDNTVHNRAENPADHEGEAEEEEAEGEEDEDDGGMSTKAVAEMADPRRRGGEDNTVHNRAENPADHAETEDEAAETEEAEEEDAEEEDGGDVPTKDVAAMADPRRREGEDNTVHNRAENPDDQRAT